MALQQAQTLLSMNSLEAVNVGVQQNNTESFAVVLCHLAELHAEQVSFRATCTNLLRGLGVTDRGCKTWLVVFSAFKACSGGRDNAGCSLGKSFPWGLCWKGGEQGLSWSINQCPSVPGVLCSCFWNTETPKGEIPSQQSACTGRVLSIQPVSYVTVIE